MIHLSNLTAFLVALAVLDITPGPDMMLVLARGIGQGRRVAFMTVVGMVFVAGVVQVGLLVFGVASLIKAFPASLLIVQYAGAAYLFYLGARLILGSTSDGIERSATHDVAVWTAVREGAVNNLTNPKSLLFMFAFLPQFVDPAAGPILPQLILLGVLQKLTGLVSLGSVALASGTVGRWLRRWPWLLPWQKRFTGCVMLGLGFRLLIYGGSGGKT